MRLPVPVRHLPRVPVVAIANRLTAPARTARARWETLMTDYSLVQFRLPPGQSTLADAARKLGVPVSALDPAYGVVPTDPADRLFAAMVDPKAVKSTKLGVAPDAVGDPAERVFSNPAIMPFGPPES